METLDHSYLILMIPLGLQKNFYSLGQQITSQSSGPVSEVNSEKVARTTTLSVYTSQALLQAVACKDKVQIFTPNIHWPFSSLSISIMLIKSLK